MGFLTQQDYLRHITQDDVDAIYADPEELEGTEETAIDEMKGYLRNRYDVEAIFSATGNERSKIIILHLVHMTLYHASSILPGRMNMEERLTRYEDAIRWLNGVQTGKIQPDLSLVDETDPGNPIKWGSYKKLNSDW